jgi:hypothetical protein
MIEWRGMKRLRPIIVNGLAILTLMGLVGIVGVWIASRTKALAWEFKRQGDLYELRFYGGRLWLDNGPQIVLQRNSIVARAQAQRRAALDYIHENYYDLRQESEDRRRLTPEQIEKYLLYRIDNDEQAALSRLPPPMAYSVHDGVIVGALLTILLILASRMDWGWHRGRFGLCVFCGYDLRATPDRCPECGNVPKSVRH